MRSALPETYNPYRDVRRVELGFTFGVVAPEAAETAQARSSAQSAVSQLDQTHDEIDQTSAKYGTLEHNLFALDGSFSFYPDDLTGVQTGWQSADISDANGDFDTNPWLRFTFAEPITSYGLMLEFDERLGGDYPKQVVTTVYDAAGRVQEKVTTTPDGWNHAIAVPVQDCGEVHFELVGTHVPCRRVRVCEAVFGMKYRYGADNITSMQVEQSVSPWAESLPATEASATIDNTAQLYNMINPDGLYQYLQSGQYMTCYAKIDGDRIELGKQYFTEASSEDGGLTASLTFHDALYALDDVPYQNGTSGTWTLAQAVQDIIAVTGRKLTAVYDDGLGSTIIRKCIPQDTSCREALRLCAQAAMCTCFVDWQNRLHFSRPEIREAADEWTRDVQHSEAQITVGQLYNAVRLTRRDEYADEEESAEEVFTARNVGADEAECVKEIDNPLAQDGDAVAAWILAWVQRRVSYAVTYRGNPALDLLDTVQIDDVYRVNGKAILTEQRLDYDGGLTSHAAAIR